MLTVVAILRKDTFNGVARPWCADVRDETDPKNHKIIKSYASNFTSKKHLIKSLVAAFECTGCKYSFERGVDNI